MSLDTAEPEAHIDPYLLASTDPLNIGFPRTDHRRTSDRDVVEYHLENGSTAYVSYGPKFGHAVVIRDRGGIEVFAGRVDSQDDARSVVTGHLSS